MAISKIDFRAAIKDGSENPGIFFKEGKLLMYFLYSIYNNQWALIIHFDFKFKYNSLTPMQTKNFPEIEPRSEEELIKDR